MNELSELIKRYKDLLCDPDIENLYQNCGYNITNNMSKYPDLDINQIALNAAKKDNFPIYILNSDTDDEKVLINSESFEYNFEYNLMLLKTAKQGSKLNIVYYNIVHTEEIYCKIGDCFKLTGGTNLWYIIK